MKPNRSVVLVGDAFAVRGLPGTAGNPSQHPEHDMVVATAITPDGHVVVYPLAADPVDRIYGEAILIPYERLRILLDCGLWVALPDPVTAVARKVEERRDAEQPDLVA